MAQPEIESASVKDVTGEGGCASGRGRRSQLSGQEKAPPAPSAVPLQMKKSTMVRVDTRLLDDLIDMVGELVTAKGSLIDYSPRWPQSGCARTSIESTIWSQASINWPSGCA